MSSAGGSGNPLPEGDPGGPSGSTSLQHTGGEEKIDFQNPHPELFADRDSDWASDVIHEKDNEDELDENDSGVAAAAAPPIVIPPPAPISEPAKSKGRGRKRKQPEAIPDPVQPPVAAAGGAGGAGTGGAAAAGAPESPWCDLRWRLEMNIPEFTGMPGIVYEKHGWLSNPVNKKQHEADMQTPIYWFQRFLTKDAIERIIEQTNIYVTNIHLKERPSNLGVKYAWPPLWTHEWEPMTEQDLWLFLATLLFVAQHKTSNEEELWSPHWFYQRPGIHRFMPYKLFKMFKAALHFQSDGEEGPGVIKKIGVLMNIIERNCNEVYMPDRNMSFDEITIGLSSPSKYRKITKHKKKHESIQFWAMGESFGGLQYCWSFTVNSPDNAVGKIHRAVMDHVHRLPKNTGYTLYMDNLFTSAKLFREIKAAGHRACGTSRVNRGGDPKIDAIKSVNGKPNAAAVAAGVTEQGTWTWSQHEDDGLGHYAWFDSGICHLLTNFHLPDSTVVKRKKKGHQGRIEVGAPQCAEDYNIYMTAIDDVDRVRELCSTRLRVFKWYWAIFFFLLDTMLNNAFTCWVKHTGDKKMSRRFWLVTLCEDMLALADGGKDGGQFEPSPGTQTHWSGRVQTAKQQFLDPTHPAFTERLRQRHFLGDTEDNKKRRNCVVCYKTMPCKEGELRVQTFCKQCDLFMHPGCFEQWHTMPDPVSPKFEEALKLQNALMRQ